MLRETLPSDCSSQYCNGGDKFDAYWRTLIFDNNSSDGFRRLKTSDLKIFREAARSMLSRWSRLFRWISGLFFWKWHHEVEKAEIAMISHSDTGTRRFYFGLTKQGYMTMLPWGTEPGDVVSILYGGRAPFVLRPSPQLENDSFLLVGPAYVHGFMDGEAITCNQDRFEERRFTLV